MQRARAPLLALRAAHGARLALRVSLDHYTRERHEAERGARSWAPAIAGLRWLASEGFAVSVAGRLFGGEGEAAARAGYARPFRGLDLALDAEDPAALVLFPELDATRDVP